jgi:hypothetical protein
MLTKQFGDVLPTFSYARVPEAAGDQALPLGLRYKIVILLRTITLVITFAMMVGIARGDPVWSGPPLRPRPLE